METLFLQANIIGEDGVVTVDWTEGLDGIDITLDGNMLYSALMTHIKVEEVKKLLDYLKPVELLYD